MVDQNVIDALDRRRRPDTPLEVEMARLEGEPDHKRQIVTERLLALDRYLRLEPATSNDADHIAGQLGLSLRSFYRLLVRLNERGPVAALSPNYGRSRRSDAVEELPPEAEVALREILEVNPDERFAQVIAYVRTRLSDAVSAAVSDHAIRKRRLEMAAEPIQMLDVGEVGRVWVVDRIALDLPIAASGRKALRLATVDVVADRATGLIAAVFLSDSGVVPYSVAWVVRELPLQLLEFVAVPFKIADDVERVEWSVPDEWIKDADAVRERGTGTEVVPHIEVIIDVADRFRLGRKLLRLMGDRMGPYKMLVRSTVYSEKTVSYRSPVKPTSAIRLISAAAKAYNEKRLAALGSRRLASADLEERRQQLEYLAWRMKLLFLPVDTKVLGRGGARLTK